MVNHFSLFIGFGTMPYLNNQKYFLTKFNFIYILFGNVIFFFFFLQRILYSADRCKIDCRKQANRIRCIAGFINGEVMENSFLYFLELLGIKHTKKYAKKVYNEHPFKNSLYAFSNLLHEYSVDNVTVQLLEEDKDITNLEAPVVVPLGFDIAIVSKIEKNFITLTTLNNKSVRITMANFNEYWNGIALLAETGSKSIEPHYSKHKLFDLFYIAQKYIFILFFCFLVFYVIGIKELYLNLSVMSLLAVNLIGVFVSYLLILKHYRIHSNYADKICSLIQEGNCNDILDSEASKLFGLIGWSEVGLSYFVSNAILIIFFPRLLPFFAVINVCALPYSFWSVWYQKFKANSWCTMCLIVQGLLWLIFIGNIIFGFFNQIQESFIFQNLIVLFCVYAIPFISINLLLSLIIEKSKTESITQEFNNIKANDDVIKVLLLKQPYFEADRSNSQILFGNKNAEILITILTNPHCKPCARMHNRLSEILLDENGKFCIQYIFSSFREEFDESSRFMIATYLNKPLKDTLRIYHDWYNGGQANRFSFFQKHKVPVDADCMNEFNKHNEWKNNAKLSATPTVLINGYKLPGNYTIEDIRFFTAIDFTGL